MNKYKVLQGRHIENDKMYLEGDVIETKADLVAIWGGHKFKLLGEEPMAPTEESAVLEDAPTQDVDDSEGEDFEGEDFEGEDEDLEEEVDYFETDDDLEEPEIEPNPVGRGKRGRPRK